MPLTKLSKIKDTLVLKEWLDFPEIFFGCLCFLVKMSNQCNNFHEERSQRTLDKNSTARKKKLHENGFASFFHWSLHRTVFLI